MNAYTGMGYNPIYFVDPTGDSLDVSGYTREAMELLKSIVDEQYHDLITLGENGQVSFNSEGVDLSSDAALELLNNLINGEGNFLFSVAEEADVITNSSDQPLPLSVNGLSQGIINASVTPRNIGDGVGSPSYCPANSKYHGSVTLGSGTWTIAQVLAVDLNHLQMLYFMSSTKIGIEL